MSDADITVREVCERLREWFERSNKGPHSDEPFSREMNWRDATVLACDNADKGVENEPPAPRAIHDFNNRLQLVVGRIDFEQLDAAKDELRTLADDFAKGRFE